MTKRRRRVGPKPPSPNHDTRLPEPIKAVEPTRLVTGKELLDVVRSQCSLALTQLERSIADTPGDDPLAGILASARTMGLSETKATMGRVADTLAALESLPIEWDQRALNLRRKAAMELLLANVIGRLLDDVPF